MGMEMERDREMPRQREREMKRENDEKGERYVVIIVIHTLYTFSEHCINIAFRQGDICSKNKSSILYFTMLPGFGENAGLYKSSLIYSAPENWPGFRTDTKKLWIG